MGRSTEVDPNDEKANLMSEVPSNPSRTIRERENKLILGDSKKWDNFGAPYGHRQVLLQERTF